MGEVGPCRASITKYYFNKDKEQCEEFIYGGCQGNGNNFDSLIECRIACEDNPGVGEGDKVLYGTKKFCVDGEEVNRPYIENCKAKGKYCCQSGIVGSYKGAYCGNE